MLGRSNSIMTKNSGGSHSRRNSVSQNSLAGSHTPSDHILSWRNTVLDNSPRNGTKTIRSDRSVSPGKFNRNSQSNTNSQNNLASVARQQQYAGTPLTHTSSIATTSPPQSIYKAPSNNISQPPTPSFSFQSASDDNVLKLDAAGKSYQFWNPASWKTQTSYPPGSKLDADSLRPPNNRGHSVVSKLSSDEGTTSGDLEDEESEGEALSCKKCGSRDFRARKVVGRGQKLVCTKCGTTAD
jgi:hypothetical protein